MATYLSIAIVGRDFFKSFMLKAFSCVFNFHSKQENSQLQTVQVFKCNHPY